MVLHEADLNQELLSGSDNNITNHFLSLNNLASSSNMNEYFLESMEIIQSLSQQASLLSSLQSTPQLSFETGTLLFEELLSHLESLDSPSPGTILILSCLTILLSYPERMILDEKNMDNGTIFDDDDDDSPSLPPKMDERTPSRFQGLALRIASTFRKVSRGREEDLPTHYSSFISIRFWGKKLLQIWGTWSKKRQKRS